MKKIFFGSTIFIVENIIISGQTSLALEEGQDIGIRGIGKVSHFRACANIWLLVFVCSLQLPSTVKISK